MLITDENASEKEKRLLKIECSSEDVYFLDSNHFLKGAFIKNVFLKVLEKSITILLINWKNLEEIL